MARCSSLPMLPREILRQIFDHFAAPNASRAQRSHYWERGDDPDRAERQRSVQNLRLVCRLFHDLASLLLFPHLVISVDRDSLEVADKISRHPIFAASVQGIIVDVRIYDASFADDAVTHKSHLKARLRDEVGRKAWRFRSLTKQEQDEFLAVLPEHAALCAAWSIPNDRIKLAWDIEIEGELSQSIIEAEGDESAQKELAKLKATCFPAQRDIDEETVREFQDVFERGHRNYASRLREQRSLLQDASFMQMMESCMRRLPNLLALSIDSKIPGMYRSGVNYHVLDMKKLESWVSTTGPPSYRRFEHDLSMAAIMSQTFMAAYNAGVKVQHLSIECFPGSCVTSSSQPQETHFNEDMELYGKGQERKLMLGELFQNMRSVCLKGIYTPMYSYWHAYLDDCISAAVSSRNMRNARISSIVGGFYTQRTVQEHRDERYSVGRVLGEHAWWPRLEKLHVTDIGFGSKHFDNLLRRVEDGRLHQVILHMVSLLDGRWADVMESLRRSMATKKSPMVPSVSLKELVGGEIGDQTGVLTGPESASLDEEFGDMGYNTWSPIVLQMAQRYCMHDPGVTVNPFSLTDRRLYKRS